VPETKAVSIPVKYFDDITPTIAEGKKMAAKGIHLQTILDENREPVDSLS